MENTIEFIKKHSPTIGKYAESLVDKNHDNYAKSNEFTNAFDWYESPQGLSFWSAIDRMTKEQLQALEKIYNPNFKPKLSLQEIANKAGVTEEELINIFKEELVK